MSIRDDLLAALAGGIERSSDELAASLARPALVVRQHLGAMRAAGVVHGDRGMWRLPREGETAPKERRPRKRREVEQLPAEPRLFDAAVWIDGTAVMHGAQVFPDGSVLIGPNDASRLFGLLARALPVDLKVGP